MWIKERLKGSLTAKVPQARCPSQKLPEGLEITEVMRLASYSKYDTALKYYPAVKDDLVDRARRAVGHRVSREMLEEED